MNQTNDAKKPELEQDQAAFEQARAQGEDEQALEVKFEAAQTRNDKNVLLYMGGALELLRDAKPEQRGELARRYAVTVTEFEKVMAYFKVYVVEARL